MRIALFAAALVVLASPALAQTEAPAPAPAPAAGASEPAAADKDDPNRMICKREREMGSNRPKKVCKTAAERERLKAQADRAGGLDRKADAGSRGPSGN